MSIALERGSGRIGGPGFARRGIGCVPVFEPAEEAAGIEGDGRRMSPASEPSVSSSSSSSSIGKDSDCCSGRERESGSDGEDSGEVQSKYKGPLDALDSLEESLPIRRGISSFYSGKSKSFTSLADAAASSASSKDLAKPENAYSRKRKNLLAFKTMWTKPNSNMLRSNGGGITKRPGSHSRSTLALAVAMSNSGSNGNSSSSSEEEQDHHRLLPPLHPPTKSSPVAPPVLSSSPEHCSFSSRSFSLTDLQGMAGSSSSIGARDKHSRFY